MTVKEQFIVLFSHLLLLVLCAGVSSAQTIND